MGFFSWNCKGCSESIKAPYGLSKSIAWQNDAVFLSPNGSRAIGAYDGYGRISDFDFGDTGVEPELWHERCWNQADKPDYKGPSTYAQDQGYFYKDSEDN